MKNLSCGTKTSQLIDGSFMITLYSGPVSWFSRKVEIALLEKEIPFHQILVPFTQTQGYQPKPEVLTRINPKGQVPVLIDGKTELYDSTVIIEYLDEAYPPNPLLPALPQARSHCRLWDVFADEVMLAPIRKLMHRTETHDHTSPRWRALETEAANALPAIALHFDQLNEALNGKGYLCGEFSLADISCFMPVFWSDRLAGPAFDTRANLRRWFHNVVRRPAFSRVIGEITAQDKALSAPVAGAFANYAVLEIGGRSRTRTYDPLIKSQLLYHLSYAPVPRFGTRAGS
jgi:glutathione S-transferase